VRKPALAKALAAPSDRRLRSQPLDASQYSSNDEGLRLLMSDNPPRYPAYQRPGIHAIGRSYGGCRD
jgi:hypothetical protein